MLIIGCGDNARGDDAAGLLVVRRLRHLGIAAEEFHGDGIALLERWWGADDVAVVDAVVTGREPGAITNWDEGECHVSDDVFACSTHGIGVAQALRLGRALGRLPRRLRIHGIEACRFDAGSPPSQAVLASVDRLARRLAHEVSSTECVDLTHSSSEE